MHPMEFNQWYFIAITYDEDFVHVFQDGKLIAQAPKRITSCLTILRWK